MTRITPALRAHMCAWLCMCALLLAACSVRDTPPAATPTVPLVASLTALPTLTPAPSATPQATVTPQPTPAPGALVLWTIEQGAGFDALKQAADAWSQRSGTPIALVSKSRDSVRVDALAGRLVDEPPPDMFWADQNALAGLLADDQLQPFGTADGAGTFIAATVSSATRDGKLWGLPIAAQGELFLLYNRALVTQPPATTDDLIVQSRAQRGDNIYGLVAGWAEARWLVALLTGFGGNVLAPDGVTPTLDTPEMASALNLLRELRVAGPPTPSTYTNGSALFGAGRAALALDGDWSLSNYRALSATLDLGIAPMPRVPATGRVAAPPLGGIYLMFSKGLNGKPLAQAQNFAAFLATPDQQIRLASATERLPALKVALAAPAIASDPVLAAAAQQVDGASGIPPTKALRCAWKAIDDQLPPLLTNERDQPATSAAMQRAAVACIGQ